MTDIHIIVKALTIKFIYVDTSMLHNDVITQYSNRKNTSTKHCLVNCQYHYIKTLYLLKSYLAVLILRYQN